MNIKLYERNGNLKIKKEFSYENLKNTAGMMTKIILKDKSEHIGYSDPLRVEGKRDEFDGTMHDYMYLWTFSNLEEKSHKLNIDAGINLERIILDEIFEVKSILYSGLRWGGHPTNLFFIDETK